MLETESGYRGVPHAQQYKLLKQAIALRKQCTPLPPYTVHDYEFRLLADYFSIAQTVAHMGHAAQATAFWNDAHALANQIAHDRPTSTEVSELSSYRAQLVELKALADQMVKRGYQAHEFDRQVRWTSMRNSSVTLLHIRRCAECTST